MSENNDDTLLDDLPDDVEYDIANEDEDALLADDELDEPAAQYLQSGGDDAADQEEYQEYEEEPLEDVLELGVTEDLLDSEIQDSAEVTPAVQEPSISRSSASRDTASSSSSSRLLLRSTSQEATVAVVQSMTVVDAAALAGESEEEDDKHVEQRNRFKSERTNVVSLKSNKTYGNIPDSLDRVVTTEDTSRQKFAGRKESGWRGRRGWARGTGGRQTFHQVQQQFQQHTGFQHAPHPQKILINPHFRGLPHQQGAGVVALWEGDRVPAALPPQQQFAVPPPQGQYPPPPSPQHFEQPAFYHQPPPQPQPPPQQIYLEQAVAPVWMEEGSLYPPPLHAPPPPQHFSQPLPPYDQSHAHPHAHQQSVSWDADGSAHIVVSQMPQYTQPQMFRPRMEPRPPMQYRQPDMFQAPPPRPRFPGSVQQVNMVPLRPRNAAVRPQAARQSQPGFRPLHKRLFFDKQQRFELPVKRKKRMPDMSNLHEVQTVDTLPDTTVSETPQQEEIELEDEETREYRKKIEEQKRQREKILQQKEERRKKSALQKQMQLQQQQHQHQQQHQQQQHQHQQQQLHQVNTSGEPPQGNAIATIVNRNTVQPARSQSVVQRLGGWGRGRGRGGRQVVHQQHAQSPAPTPAVATPVAAPQQRPKLFTVRTKTGEVKQVWGTVVQSQTGQRVVRCVPQQTIQQRRIVVTQQPTPQPAAQPRQVVAGRGRTVLLRGTEPPAQPQTQRIIIQKSAQAGVGGNRVVLPKKAADEGGSPQQVLPRTKVVSIDNLAASTSEAQLRKMCQRVGTVESLQMYSKQRRAVVTFANPAAAATFFKRYQRKMVDLSLISVTLVVK